MNVQPIQKNIQQQKYVSIFVKGIECQQFGHLIIQ